MVGAAGVGKTMVLREALRLGVGPSRRVALVRSPIDWTDLLSSLSKRLGGRAGGSVAEAWSALGDAVRLCRYQRQAVVLAIDAEHATEEGGDCLDIRRLAHIDPHPEARVTVVRSLRTPRVTVTAEGDWELPIRVVPLTRTECSDYMAAKLTAAGGAISIFTPTAITRLHGLAGGVPRGIDRLASLSLLAAIERRSAAVTPDVIECIGGGWLEDFDRARGVPA